MKSNPYTIAALHRPDMPQVLFYYVSDLKEIPVEIPLICGDVLQNLRSALDHLAGQLAISAGKTIGKNSAFPIFENVAKYRSGAAQKVERMRPEARKAIADLEPYGGGKGEALWHLHQLNNIDKHRVILTAASLVAAIDALPHWARQIPQLRPLAEHGYVFIPHDDYKCFPIQVGSILFETPDKELDPKLRFSFEIALGDREVRFGQPVLQVVTELMTAVEGVLDDLAPFL